MATPQPPRKNLIIITADEMRGDCPGYMGNPDCQTPFLDRFAERSVAFQQHFAVHGKCLPSRISIASGRYCHTDGLRTVNESNLLPSGTPNLLPSLKNAGYESAVFGINHVWEDFWGDNSKSSGVVDYHCFTRDSFDHLLQRQYPVEQPGPGSAPIRFSPDTPSLEVTRLTEPITYMSDDNRTEQAIHYLRTVRDRTRPFFLQLNLGAPHPPYQVEEPYFSMYDREAITPWPYDLPDGAPLHLRKMREFRSGRAATEADFRQVQAVYYGMISKVDALLGRFFSAIEEDGYLENSVVLFTVDHGDFAGQYGLPEKWDSALNDCLLHVPLILHAPGLPEGRRVDSLTEHVDIAPTLLELLGLQPDWVLHGASLLPAIHGQTRKDVVFADGGHEADMRRRFNGPRYDTAADGRTVPATQGKQETYLQAPDTMARAKMARSERWKLVIRETGGNELYDLLEDPYEMYNLWELRESYPDVLLDLQQRMIEWCLRTDTDRPRQEMVVA